MNLKYINLAQWIALLGIFCNDKIELITISLACIILFIGNPVFYKSKILKYFILTAGVSLVTIKMVGYDTQKYVQQVIIVGAYLLFYEQFFKQNRKNFAALFKKYIKVVYAICIIGIIQEIIFLGTHVNVMSLLPDYHADHFIAGSLLRITSTLSEGGWLGTSLLPALVYLFYYNDFYHILGNHRWVVLAVSAFTVSPIVYIVVAFIFATKISGKFLLFRKISVILGILLVGIVISAITSTDKYDDTSWGDIAIRYRDTWNGLKNINSNDLYSVVDNTNTSTAVSLTNLFVAIHAPSRFFGTGIGTNSQNYYKVVKVTSVDNALNTDDGYSLFNRILSEFGIVGLILYILFIVKHYNNKNPMNLCFLIMIGGLFLRGGSYILYGTIFIHYFYYYTSKYNLAISNQRENELR